MFRDVQGRAGTPTSPDPSDPQGRGLPLPRFTYHARYLHHPVGDGVLDVPPPRHAHGVIVRFRLTVDPGRFFTVPGGASPSPTTGRIGFRVNRYPFAIPTPGRRGRRPLQKIGCITPAARGRRPLPIPQTRRGGASPSPTGRCGITGAVRRPREGQAPPLRR